jgi:transposase
MWRSGSALSLLGINKSMNKYAPKNLNKDEVQKLYDSGLSLKKLAKQLCVSERTIQRLNLVTRSKSVAGKIADRNFSKEGLHKLSELAKARSLGGYRPHPNKGQRYNDMWFDSKWEVKVAESLDKHSVIWERPKKGFIWTDSGRKYYPDFYLPEFNVYLDPKNSYLQIKDLEKITQAQQRNNIRVLMLSESQLSWESIQLLL